MSTSQAAVAFVLVADSSADPRKVAAALSRAAESQGGRVVLVSSDPAGSRKVRRYAARGFATLTVRTRAEAAAVAKGLRPLRIAFQIDDPLEFSVLLLDSRRNAAAA
jgi:histidinol dehydrogenase